ncbi:MAG: methionine--tRNA ligase subunit beta, partial [Candidatus Coatesbacteria bacterium]|nr:methionine--tRNA ligase subunit beta [Candidatus Coatesbacteria bacterium]
LEFRNALEAVWELISKANVCIDREKPWALYNSGDMEKLGSVLYSVLETGRIVLNMLHPFIPSAAEQMLRQLGAPETGGSDLPDRAKWGGLVAGNPLGELAPVFVKRKVQKQTPEKPAPSNKKKEKGDKVVKPEIAIDDFAKVQLVVGEITNAEPVEGSQKLLKLAVDIGDEVRQAVAGMREFYEPDEMVGKKVIFLANLAPAKIFGIESQGMILAAEGGGIVSLLSIDKDVPIGSGIR